VSGILRLPAVTVTTRHSPAVYPWRHTQTLPGAGVLIGVNALAGNQVLRYDPWVCYQAGIVTSPNMIVAGQLGRGKSALVKTYLHRQLRANRQAYILDPKGEYCLLAAATGLTVIALRPGGTARLNPLDPPPGALGPEQLTTSRAVVVGALAGAGLGRELGSEERVALTAAIRGLPDRPVLADVVTALLHPTAAMATELVTTPGALAAAVRPVAMELHRLLAGDLSGMVNGESTVTLNPDGPGVVVDLSAVRNTDAQAAVMVCAGAWLAATLNSATLDADTTRRRLLLVDEAWALLANPATTRWLQQTSKLARACGVQLITVIHRLSDLAAQTDAGTAARAQAEGLLADAETRVIYGQAPTERRLATDLLDLTETEADLVCGLVPYRGLWRIGEHTAVVDHVLSGAETALVDTDQQMRP
jgi:type IV secretory pathway VirB4 component